MKLKSNYAISFFNKFNLNSKYQEVDNLLNERKK